jgi:hypothetical protein
MNKDLSCLRPGMISRRLPTQRFPKYFLSSCTNHQRTSRITSPYFVAHRPLSFTRDERPKPPLRSQPLAIRLLPTALQPDEQSTSSLRRIAQLALTEKKPLSIAIGLVSNTPSARDSEINTVTYYQLLVSSSVSMSVPFAIGRIIDYFTSPDPVCISRLTFNIT